MIPSAKHLKITKASGESVDFSEEKLRRSLTYSGAGEADIDHIVQQIHNILYEGITTKEIYRRAYQLLKSKTKKAAGKYKLKQALMELGPAGYAFEVYVSELLKYQGYIVDVGVYVQGHCVSHEVDVVAEKDNQHFMVECKHHSYQGNKCDVKVPLYIQSRFKDVEKQWQKQSGHHTKFHQGWVFTNTKFTTDAVQYGECIGLKLVGWDHPRRGSLKERIEIAQLYPITCLTSLTRAETAKLLESKVVLCKDILDKEYLLRRLKLSEIRITKVITEAKELINHTV